MALALVAALLFLAFAVRVFHLDFLGLSSDEASFTRIAYQNTIIQAVFGPEEPHPPTYLYLLHGWMGPAGFSEFAIRFPSVIFGVAAVAGLYVLGRQLGGQTLGLTAGFLLAINPYAILYSQTARDYAQALCFGVLSFVLLFWALRRPALVPAYAFTAFLAMFSHYYAAAIVAAEQVVLLGWLLGWWLPANGKLRPWAVWRRWLIADLAMTAPLLAWVAVVFRQLASYNSGRGSLQVVRDSLRDTFQWFNFGPAFRSSDAFRPSIVFAVLLVLGFFGLVLWRRRAAAVGLAYLLSPILLGLAALLHQSQFAPRLLLVGIPGYALLLAGGVLTLWRLLPLLGVASLLFLTAFAGVSFRNAVLTDEFVTNGYPPLASYLAGHIQPRDTVILDGVSQWPWYWYYVQLRHGITQRVEFMPRGDGHVDAARTEADLRDLASSSSGLWFVDSDALRYDPGLLTERIMAQDWFQSFAHNFVFQRLQYYGVAAPGPLRPVERAHFSGMDLTAAAVPDRPVAAGQPLGVTLRWTAAQDTPAAFKVSLRLETPAGDLSAQNDAAPQGGFFSTNRWKKGDAILDNHGLEVPVGAIPGDYLLRVLAYDAGSGKALGSAVTIGKVTVDHSAPQRVSAAGLPALGVDLAGERLAAAGLDVSSAAAGDPVGLTLLWTGGPTQRPAAVSVSIGAESVDHVIGGSAYPTTRWQPADVVRDRFVLHTPPTLTPGAYPIRVGGVTIGRLNLTPGHHLFTPPPVATPSQARFGDLVELAGYGLSRQGENLRLQLTWHVLDTTDVPYKVFVHALAPDGHIEAQVDQQTGSERWVKGEYVASAYDLPPSARGLRLEIGLYEESSGRRLPVGSGDSLVLAPPSA